MQAPFLGCFDNNRIINIAPFIVSTQNKSSTRFLQEERNSIEKRLNSSLTINHICSQYRVDFSPSTIFSCVVTPIAIADKQLYKYRLSPHHYPHRCNSDVHFLAIFAVCGYFRPSIWSLLINNKLQFYIDPGLLQTREQTFLSSSRSVLVNSPPAGVPPAID